MTVAQTQRGERLALEKQREQRIGARQSRMDPTLERKGRAQASKTMAEASRTRAEAFAIRQKAKNPAGIGSTQTFTILGQDVKLPSFETPGVDPTRMAG